MHVTTWTLLLQHPRMKRTQQRFTDHHQHLHKLKVEAEACRLKLLKTGSQLKGHSEEGLTSLPRTEGMEAVGHKDVRAQYLPPIANTNKGHPARYVTLQTVVH